MVAQGDGSQEPETADAEAFVGSERCKACHEAECKVWKASLHSHAFETLRDKGRERDLECVSCHTTGYGQPGGFSGVNVPARLEGVGCEVCHGADRKHLADTQSPYPTVASCVTCHTETASPKFDLDAYWRRIAHGKDETAN